MTSIEAQVEEAALLALRYRMKDFLFEDGRGLPRVVEVTKTADRQTRPIPHFERIVWSGAIS